MTPFSKYFVQIGYEAENYYPNTYTRTSQHADMIFTVSRQRIRIGTLAVAVTLPSI
jgi:hypothetical protein